MKTCTVVYATPDGQRTCRIELADAATVAEALVRARQLWADADVPWEGEVGIFGEPCARDAVPRHGDRIEIYRPLRLDPKESRRDRVQRARREARDRAAAVPRPPGKPRA